MYPVYPVLIKSLFREHLKMVPKNLSWASKGRVAEKRQQASSAGPALRTRTAACCSHSQSGSPAQQTFTEAVGCGAPE